jgi:hypothetical protein
MSDLLSGLVQGYAAASERKLARQENDEMKKLQIKLFKQKLDEEDKTKAALGQLTEMLSGGQQIPGQPQVDDEGFQMPPATTSPMSLKDALSSPQGQALAVKSGYKLDDIRQFQQPSVTDIIAGMQTNGAIDKAGGGLELTGLKIGPNGQMMPDLSRAKFKQELPSGDGSSMIRIDEYGREMGRRPIAASERKAPEQSRGQNAVDDFFGKEYAEFKAIGGYASVEKGLDQLTEASKALKKGGLTGPVRGNTPDLIRQFSNPDALAVRDSVQEVVQANLRQVLGPAFTQKEGEGVMARAFNEKLSDAENEKRLGRLITQIRTAALAKQEAANYFEQNGTLKGFKGKLWTSADFLKNDGEKPSLKGPGKSDDPLGLRK